MGAGDLQHGVVGGRGGHAEGGVDRSARLRVGAGVVDQDRPVTHHDGDADGVRVVGDAVVLQDLLGRVLAVGDGGDLGTHQALRVGDELPGRRQDGGGAVAVEQLAAPPLAHVQGAEHGVEVAPGGARRAVVGHDDAPDVALVLAAAHQLHRRQAQPFLEHLGGVARERADHHGADLGDVADDRHEQA